MSSDSRTDRAARNEHMFRRVNDRLHALARINESSIGYERFVCECFQPHCAVVVELTVDEYRNVRAEGARFLVAPEGFHVDLTLESVLERHDRYWVIEKRGGAGATAEALDDATR